MAFSPFFRASWEGFPGIPGDLPQCCRKRSAPRRRPSSATALLSQLYLVARCRRFQETRRVSNKRLPKKVANRQDSNIKVFSTPVPKERAPLARRLFPSPPRPGATESRPGIAERDRHQRGALGPDLELLAGRQGQLRRRPRGRRPVRATSPRTSWHRPAAAGVPRPRRRYLAGEAGIRQFLDIGTGLPTVDNTHEVAQRVAPESRIVYVDNDPLVLAHARALLTSTPEGVTDYIDADLRDPETILGRRPGHARLHPAGRADADGHPGPHRRRRRGRTRSSRRLLDALPSGSYLVDRRRHQRHPRQGVRRGASRSGTTPAGSYFLRKPEQIAPFFDGLELVEPGVVSCLAVAARTRRSRHRSRSGRVLRRRPETLTRRPSPSLWDESCKG